MTGYLAAVRALPTRQAFVGTRPARAGDILLAMLKLLALVAAMMLMACTDSTAPAPAVNLAPCSATWTRGQRAVGPALSQRHLAVPTPPTCP